MTLELEGSQRYTIDINGRTYSTEGQEITLPLDRAGNRLTVSGGSDCQGTYEDTIVLTDRMLAYPNPISDGEELSVYLGQGDGPGTVRATVFDLGGTKVMERELEVQWGTIKIDMDKLPQGTYILSVTDRNTQLYNHKIVKR